MEHDGNRLPQTGMTAEEVRTRFGEPMLVFARGGEENWIYQTPRGEVRVRFVRVASAVFVTDDDLGRVGEPE